MFLHHLTTALRHFWKHKLITGIKVLGLGIGVSATLVIFLMVRYEYSFDRHVPGADRVYRIVNNDATWKSASMLVPLIPFMENELSGVENLAPVFQLNGTDGNLKVFPGEDQEKLFKNEDGIAFTNPDYFELFPHEWLAGSPEVLGEPGQIVLTESKLHRYYPGQSPTSVMGNTVLFHDSVYVKVAGVVKDVDKNSDFDYQAFVSTSTIAGQQQLREMYNWENWNSFNDAYQCLIRLAPGVSMKTVQAGMEKLLQHQPTEEPAALILQPLREVHFNGDFNYNATKTSTLSALGLLALFILLLGAINFINLSTAQSIERAKEIGIRKSLGSGKRALLQQFLTETFTLTLCATVLSILLTPLLFHAFQSFLPQDMQYPGIGHTDILTFLGIQILAITLLAGLYPAWVMLGYRPALALKNQVSGGRQYSRSAWVRQTLTVTQFIIAQVLLIGVLVVNKQIRFALNKDMGFRKEAVVNFYIPNFSDWKDQTRLVLRDRLRAIPEVQAVSLGNQTPAFNGSMMTTLDFDPAEEGEKPFTFDSRNGDEAYLSVYNIPLIAGRNIRLLDTLHEALVNETMAKSLGFKNPQDVIGKTFAQGSYRVVGVMKDFDIASVHHAIRPTMYWGQEDRGYVMHVALNPGLPGTWTPALKKMEKVFKKFYPENDFDYSFLDDSLAALYKQETRLSQLLSWAVGLSIFIACLGLFGLAIFTAHRRTKEIGIRKVVGASVFQIIFLLLKNLIGLVLLACLIAFPIAWYFMHAWLADFAFHTPLSIGLFVLSAAGMTIMAILVLSLRTFQAARANPVEALKTE